MKRSTTKRNGKLSQFPAALFNRRAAALLATGALLLTGNSAFADSLWTAGTGDYNVAGNWNPVGVPNAVNVIVNNGGTVLIQAGDPDWTVHDVRAGDAANASGTYTQTAATVHINGGWFRLGTSAGSSGTYNLNGGALTMDTNGAINIAENSGTGAGTSTLSVGGTGTFNNTVGGASAIAVGGQDNGGGVGKGILNLSGGGTINNNGELWVGENAGSVGTMNMSGGTLNQANWLAIGRASATGTVNLSGGTINKTGGGNITLAGIGNTQTATINQTGGALNNTSSGTWIGENGIGIWNMSAGTANLGGTGYLDIDRNGGTGTVNLSGTGLITVSQIQKSGTTGTGTLNLNGGTLQASQTNATFLQGLTATNVQTGGATFDPNSFSITVGQALLHSGTGTDGGLTVNDSSATPGTLILTGANTYNGQTTITNGTLQIGNGTTDGSIASTSGVTDNGALNYNLLANRSVGYGISGTGSVTLNDTNATTKGTLTLTNANTYTGATNVTSGNLTLDHSGANTGSLGNTAVTVSGTNTLLVKGSTGIGSPGTGSLTLGTGSIASLQDNTINTLGIGGALNLNASALNFDLGTTSGSNDLFNVGGAVNATGTTTLNLKALGAIQAGTSTYTLITAASGLGAAGEFALGAEPAGFNTYSLASSTATQEILSITANATVNGTEYWTGAASRTIGDTTVNNFGDGTTLATPQSNFSTNKAGTVDPKQVPGATTDLVFTANNATPSTGTTLNTTLDANYSLRSLTFDVPTATTITSTVINTNGNTLTLGAGGLTIASTSVSAGTINGTGSVTLNGSQTFADNSANALTVSTGIAGNAGSGTNTLTFAGTGSGLVTLGGPISDGVLGGNLGLVVSKTGGGVLALNGANTYSGGNTLNSGTVQLGSATALGAATNALTFGAGSTSDLQLNGNSITVSGLSTNATVGTPIIENAGAANATLTDITAPGTATFGGVLQNGTGGGTLALNETGTGTLVLTGANTYSGGTTINSAGGGLTLGTGGTLGGATGNTTVTAGTLDLGGNSVTQNSLTLGGGNVVGPTSTLTLGATSGTAVLISGGAYSFAGTPADTANLILNGGNIVKTLGGTSGNFGNGTPVISGNITLNGNSTVALQDSPGDAFPEMTLSGVISGSGALTQDNRVGTTSNQEFGSLLLSNANTYTGGTNITFGRTEVANNTALGTGLVTIGTNGTLALGGGQIRNVNGGDLTLANNFTIGHNVSGTFGQDAIENDFGNNTLTGTVALTASTQVVTNSNLTITGQVTATATPTFTKLGGGTLTIANALTNTLNTGTGYPGFLVNQGNVVLGATGATASGQVNNIGGELDLGGSGTNGNVAMDINSGTTAINGGGAYLGIGRGNSANGATSILTLHQDAVVTSQNASLGYSAGLAGYNSKPTFTLNDTSSYTDANVFRLGESNGSNATLNVNNASSVTVNGTGGNHLFVGDGGIGTANQNNTSTVTTASSLILGNAATGNGTYNLNGGTLITPSVAKGAGTGTFNFNGGTLKSTASDPTGGSFVSGVTTNILTGGAIVNTNGNNDTISTALVGSATDGGLTKTGAGNLTLTGADTYTGATTITAGTLTVGNGNATTAGTTGSLANTSAVTAGGGTTLITANNGALSSTATNVNLGDGNGGATLQNAFLASPTTAGNAQTAGNLTLGLGTEDILDFGAGNTGAQFNFTGFNVPGVPGTSLNIRDYVGTGLVGVGGGTDELFFTPGLTAAQLSDISFLNADSSQFGATQLASGEIVENTSPAPEPAQTAALGLFGLGLGALVLKARKRNAKAAQNG